MKIIQFHYLGQSIHDLKLLADKDEKGGLETIGECLNEFFDLLRLSRENRCPELRGQITGSRQKINALLKYVGTRQNVTSYRDSYKDLLEEFGKHVHYEIPNQSDSHEPFPMTKEEYPGKFIRLKDCDPAVSTIASMHKVF